MKREAYLKLLTISFALLACFIIGELGIRFIGFYDADGNFFVGRTSLKLYRLKPYRLPVLSVKEKIDNYFSPSDTKPLYSYDPDVGWIFYPNSRGDINSYGMRTTREYQLSPPEDVLRIAIFGDSFAAGADVPFDKTWGYCLEKNLNKAGINSEVLNFGVGGYGMDQAFLRWKTLGRKFSPHIVIFGFQPENTKRNVNLIRAIFFANTGIPFTKPRFILDEKKELQLINVPTVSPEKIVDLINNVATWDMRRYEYFLNDEDYRDKIWLKSKLVAFILEIFNRLYFQINEEHFFALDREPSQLTMKIIQEFKRDVEACGGKFVVVHLPIHNDLSILLSNKKLAYSELLDKIKEENVVIHPENELVEEARKSSLDTVIRGHYTVRGYEIVGDVVAKFIIDNIDNLTSSELEKD